MTLKSIAAAACLTFTAATASFAAPFTVNGTNYDLTTLNGSFTDNQDILTNQVWWGSESLAIDFATAVMGNLTGSFAFAQPVSDELLAIEYNFFGAFDTIASPDDVQTYVVASPVAAVPLPAGGLLLLSGLAVIAGRTRRKA